MVSGNANDSFIEQPKFGVGQLYALCFQSLRFQLNAGDVRSGTSIESAYV